MVALHAQCAGWYGPASVEGVEALALGEVPQHGDAVLAAGRAQAAVG